MSYNDEFLEKLFTAINAENSRRGRNAYWGVRLIIERQSWPLPESLFFATFEQRAKPPGERWGWLGDLPPFQDSGVREPPFGEKEDAIEWVRWYF